VEVDINFNPAGPIGGKRGLIVGKEFEERVTGSESEIEMVC